jgi:hypothetical protein
MHAMTVRIGGRFAVLLGAEWNYLARTAYAVAHEIGHVLLGHLDEEQVLLEMGDPLRESGEGDVEEEEADRFALEVLTGSSEPIFVVNTNAYSSASLAQQAQREGKRRGIDPGVLALCLAYSNRQWAKSYAALKRIGPGPIDAGKYVNDVAVGQLRWEDLSLDNQEYLARVMGREDVA